MTTYPAPIYSEHATDRGGQAYRWSFYATEGDARIAAEIAKAEARDNSAVSQWASFGLCEFSPSRKLWKVCVC